MLHIIETVTLLAQRGFGSSVFPSLLSLLFLNFSTTYSQGFYINFKGRLYIHWVSCSNSSGSKQFGSSVVSTILTMTTAAQRKLIACADRSRTFSICSVPIRGGVPVVFICAIVVVIILSRPSRQPQTKIGILLTWLEQRILLTWLAPSVPSPLRPRATD